MTTVAPPPPPLPQSTQSAPLPVAAVVNPPATLTKLAIGALLKGMITQQDAKGEFQLQTPSGTLTIKTALTLPRGALLTLQIHALQPQAQLQILTVDGKAPRQVPQNAGQAGPQAAGGKGAPGVAQSGAAPPGISSVNLTVGGVVTATLIRLPQGQASVFSQHSAQGAQIPQGAQGGAVPQQTGAAPSIQGKPAPPQPAASTSAPEAPAAQKFPTTERNVRGTAKGQVAQGRGAQAPTAAATQVGVGSQVGVKVVSIQPPPSSGPLLSAPKGGAATLSAGQTLNAIVTGTSPSGSPIVMTGAGEMTLAARANLTVGAALILQVIGKPTPPQAPLHAFSHATGAGMFMSRDWPALGEAVATMRESDLAIAQHLLNNVMPQPNSQLAANVLFFLAALRGGNLLNWLGDGPNKLLQKVKPGLLDRLKDDFKTLGRMSREPTPAGDWRISLVPFFNGAELEQIRMMTRQQGGDDADEEENTRFIIDVELTKIGRLQLDGLLRNKGKHMDLVVRTESRLPEQMRNGIREILRESSELTGIQGGVTFQASPPNFIDLAAAEIAAGSDKDGLIV